MRILKKSSLALAVGLIGSAVALALGPIPPKWKVPDGGQVTHKPPPIASSSAAFVQNNGVDQVVLTSTGTSETATLVLQPSGVVVEFAMPSGAKKVVISDAHVNGAGASGTLVWGQPSQPDDDVPGRPARRTVGAAPPPHSRGKSSSSKSSVRARHAAQPAVSRISPPVTR